MFTFTSRLSAALLERQIAISEDKFAQAQQDVVVKKQRLDYVRSARVTSATVPAPFTLHSSPAYTYDIATSTQKSAQTSKPTCSVCGHIKFEGVYTSFHGSVNTPRHLNPCNDPFQCIMCNSEFCKVPSNLRLPVYPVPPVPKRPPKNRSP